MATTWSSDVAASIGAAEGVVSEFTLAKASGAQNRIDISGTVKDAGGTAVASAVFLAYLSDDATAGAGESDFSPSSAAATFSTGSLLMSLEENGTTPTAFLVKTDANGDFEIRYTDTAQEAFVFCALPFDGGAPTLLEIVTGDYTD